MKHVKSVLQGINKFVKIRITIVFLNGQVTYETRLTRINRTARRTLFTCARMTAAIRFGSATLGDFAGIFIVVLSPEITLFGFLYTELKLKRNCFSTDREVSRRETFAPSDQLLF